MSPSPLVKISIRIGCSILVSTNNENKQFNLQQILDIITLFCQNLTMHVKCTTLTIADQTLKI